jgi:peptidoglycan hydrolase-like protein with peptidoglycan-binding domain
VNRRFAVPVAGAAIAALAAGVGWAALGGEEQAAAETTNGTTPRSTVQVERRDLVRRESLDGTLSFADERALTATGPGTLTRLPAEGRIVRRGEVLYEVDGRSVRLLYGTRPAWRSLSRQSSNGEDIRQLEQNLVALGYDPDGDIEVDNDFDWATEAAIKRWEDARGATKDGVVEQNEIAFLPGPRRIGGYELTVGAPLQPGASIGVTTSKRRVVTVQLNATDQELVSQGDAVRVTLPDGRSLDGKITEVGAVAKTEQNPDGSQGTPYVDVEITLAGSGAGLDQAPVEVDVESDRSDDTLVVPVSALLAVTGGGYALETTDGRLIAVETGLFADGYVEVSGKGVRPRLRVVVPA